MSAPVAVTEVVAGVLCDARGRVLLAQRPEGKELAGCWEFPGGKREAGESMVEALRRELREELAIEAMEIDPQPLLQVPIHRHDRELRLDAHRVCSWQGEPCGQEAQAVRWQAPESIDPAGLAPADRAILERLRSSGLLVDEASSANPSPPRPSP